MAVTSLAVAIAGPASAQPTPPQPVSPGFGSSLRLSYGVPAGSTGNVAGGTSTDFTNTWSGSLPIQLDLGYRFTPNVSAAVFGQYAFGFVSSDVSTGCLQLGASCSGNIIRLGVEGFFHLMPGNQLDPWAGIGVGYEWDKISFEIGGVTGDSKFHGFEFVNLQLGADWLVAPSFGVGPFVQVTFAQFSSSEVSSATAGGVTVSQDFADKKLHEWVHFGIRGTYNL